VTTHDLSTPEARLGNMRDGWLRSPVGQRFARHGFRWESLGGNLGAAVRRARDGRVWVLSADGDAPLNRDDPAALALYLSDQDFALGEAFTTYEGFDATATLEILRAADIDRIGAEFARLLTAELLELQRQAYDSVPPYSRCVGEIQCGPPVVPYSPFHEHLDPAPLLADLLRDEGIEYDPDDIASVALFDVIWEFANRHFRLAVPRWPTINRRYRLTRDVMAGYDDATYVTLPKGTVFRADEVGAARIAMRPDNVDLEVRLGYAEGLYEVDETHLSATWQTLGEWFEGHFERHEPEPNTVDLPLTTDYALAACLKLARYMASSRSLLEFSGSPVSTVAAWRELGERDIEAIMKLVELAVGERIGG
jgi:hypothetical protein